MATLCIWCGTEHEAGVEGFCSEDCRRDFNTACRIWAAAEYEAERVSIFDLRTAFYERAHSAILPQKAPIPRHMNVE